MTNSWMLLSIVVGATVASDLLSSFEMKRAGEVHISGGGIGRFLRLFVQRALLILSIACMAVSFFAFMTLVETADMSFAVPASAASVVLETILASVILKETVDRRRWIGAALVAVGVWLLAV